MMEPKLIFGRSEHIAFMFWINH